MKSRADQRMEMKRAFPTNMLKNTKRSRKREVMFKNCGVKLSFYLGHCGVVLNDHKVASINNETF